MATKEFCVFHLPDELRRATKIAAAVTGDTMSIVAMKALTHYLYEVTHVCPKCGHFIQLQQEWCPGCGYSPHS